MLSSLLIVVGAIGEDSSLQPDTEGSASEENASEIAIDSTPQPEGNNSGSRADHGRGKTDLTLDPIFFTLSNSRRRGIIYCLKRADDPLDVSRLTTLVAAMENGVSPEAVTYSQRKRVYTSIHQSHLPKMDSLGIVDFDQRAGTVESANGLSEIEGYLEISPRSRLSWTDLYFGVGALSLGAALLGWFDVFPFGLVPGIAYLIAFATVLVTISVVHRILSRTKAAEDDLDTEVIQEL